ncbi:CBS domain-containing protein [Actinomadura sp. NPDC048394]|jgi:CBS domain-containing protein|uniref:CBS domain-containing protein n=1 Tax=Actinomadura sp. NPDC048394 TaxID=3158223 RepID=UPI0033C12353
MAAHRPLEKRTAAEVMTLDLLTISESESVLMAWELMCQAGVHHLPVADDEGGFIGVVDAQTLTASWGASGPEQARRAVTTLLPPGPPVTVPPTATIAEAAGAMLKAGRDYVPVTDDRNVLVGLLTAHDLVSGLAGVHRDIAPRSGGMPSLYRIEPVFPAGLPGRSTAARMGPD